MPDKDISRPRGSCAIWMLAGWLHYCGQQLLGKYPHELGVSLEWCSSQHSIGNLLWPQKLLWEWRSWEWAVVKHYSRVYGSCWHIDKWMSLILLPGITRLGISTSSHVHRHGNADIPWIKLYPERNVTIPPKLSMMIFYPSQNILTWKISTRKCTSQLPTKPIQGHLHGKRLSHVMCSWIDSKTRFKSRETHGAHPCLQPLWRNWQCLSLVLQDHDFTPCAPQGPISWVCCAPAVASGPLDQIFFSLHFFPQLS